MTDHTYLAKLRRLGEGGQTAERRALDSKLRKPEGDQRLGFWDGYLQALDDLEDHESRAAG